MWLILAAFAAEPAPLGEYRCARLRRDEEMLPSGEMSIRVLRSWHRLRVDEFAELVGDRRTPKRIRNREIVWALTMVPLGLAGFAVSVHGLTLWRHPEKRRQAVIEFNGGGAMSITAGVVTRRMMAANRDFSRFYTTAEVDDWIGPFNAAIRDRLGLSSSETAEIDKTTRFVPDECP
jgi:hypothetical protein